MLVLSPVFFRFHQSKNKKQKKEKSFMMVEMTQDVSTCNGGVGVGSG